MFPGQEDSRQIALQTLPPPRIFVGALLKDLASVLDDPIGVRNLPRRIRRIGADISELLAEDADRALFEVNRYGRDQHLLYSAMHALRCAIALTLISRRIGLSASGRQSVVCAALTMNVAITGLQGRLASNPIRSNRLSADDRRTVTGHPRHGAEILRCAGVDDAEWLAAVEQHHELPGGGGYPDGEPEPSRLAHVLGFVDRFFAKISARASRPAMPLRRAARELYATREGRLIVEALVREFGLYPPGTFVRLANGDIGIVLRRGFRVDSPLVVALGNSKGERLPRRVYRDTAESRYAIVLASNVGSAAR